MKTDDLDLVVFAERVVDGAGGRILRGVDSQAGGAVPAIRTIYEERYRREGRTIYEREFRFD